MSTSDDLFWSHVERTDDCWFWRGCTMSNGYGKLNRAGRGVILAHRYSYEANVGPIPTGLDVCHRCDIRNCVRPDHLFVGTRADNMADAKAKGRTTIGDRNPSRMYPERRPRAETHGRAVLTNAQVRAIRSTVHRPDRPTDAAVAAEYGVSRQTINRIRKRTHWRSLD